jgi:hypothetical protein
MASPRVYLHNLNRILKKRIRVNARTNDYTRRPLLPPGFLVVSCGTGVTSSILPILKPALASALIAACAPGPGILGPTPPTALTRIWSAVIPFDFATSAAATADFIAA